MMFIVATNVITVGRLIGMLHTRANCLSKIHFVSFSFRIIHIGICGPHSICLGFSGQRAMALVAISDILVFPLVFPTSFLRRAGVL